MNTPHSKPFLSLFLIGWFLLALFPSSWFFSMKMDSSKSANISNTIHTMKVAMRSPMCVHDVVGESSIYYLHHEGT
jgi:hypothetical protein